MRRGLYLAPFDDLANPRLLAELATVAESRGWDGLFLWDRIAYPPSDRAVADPWVALSAIASTTDNLRIGAMIEPGHQPGVRRGCGAWSVHQCQPHDLRIHQYRSTLTACR